MNTREYEKSEHFERNRAIYVLCTVDGAPTDYVALNFNMNIKEVESVLSFHKKYEALLK